MPEVNPEILIKQVEAVSFEGAAYLRKNIAWCRLQEVTSLTDGFVWSESPQGHHFWSNINYKLGG